MREKEDGRTTGRRSNGCDSLVGESPGMESLYLKIIYIYIYINEYLPYPINFHQPKLIGFNWPDFSGEISLFSYFEFKIEREREKKRSGMSIYSFFKAVQLFNQFKLDSNLLLITNSNLIQILCLYYWYYYLKKL